MNDVRTPLRALIAARVPDSDRESIERIALENDRSTSREVARAVRFYVSNLDAAEAFFRETKNRAARPANPAGQKHHG